MEPKRNQESQRNPKNPVQEEEEWTHEPEYKDRRNIINTYPTIISDKVPKDSPTTEFISSASDPSAPDPRETDSREREN